jgi:ABC-2 type transport system permease protein
MKAFFDGVGVIFSLEMRQRLRGVAWYVLLGVFFFILLIVTGVFAYVIFVAGDESSADRAEAAGPALSTVIYLVLLLGTLVAPAMSGNAINGDRDAGTLATTQVTLTTTWQLVIGKFLAAWVTALGFLAVSSPFLVVATIAGKLAASTLIVSVLVLALELGVVAAIGVGLSGLIPRPLFSVVVTYLVIAALSLGTLIAFALGGVAVQTKVVDYSFNKVDFKTHTCSEVHSYTESVPRYDLDWGFLAANPYVILADAVPVTYDRYGQPQDLFGDIKLGERGAQLSPVRQTTPAQECADETSRQGGTELSSRQTIDKTTPLWAVGLGIQILLAVGALVGGWARTRTPAGKLPRGNRVA